MRVKCQSLDRSRLNVSHCLQITVVNLYGTARSPKKKLREPNLMTILPNPGSKFALPFGPLIFKIFLKSVVGIPR